MQNKNPAWLRDAVFYQVYPQSFYDSNGDGIGDLPGIVAKLDYIRSLGCTALWLNPCFVTPFGDAGYDVANYYKVAPRYGNNADLQRLFRAAHRRGLKVLLDLVPGHTSSEHPWFKESCRAEKNRYTNRYIWSDNPNPGRDQNMDFIKGYADRMGGYLTNYYWFQPALNYGFAHPDPRQPWQLPMNHPDCLAVRAELKKIMRFWLRRGADGFRVDMARSLVKNDPDRKGVTRLWREIRAMLDKEFPEAAMVAEWSYPKDAIRAGFHMDFLIHFQTTAFADLFLRPDCFFSRAGRGDITAFLREFEKHYRPTRGKGYICIPTSNHDMERLTATRTPAELRVAFAFLLTMPGVPFIYYGEEIGLPMATEYVPREGGYSRNGTRIPMAWTRGKNAGFSTAAAKRLYLPLSVPAGGGPNVADQDRDPDSLLNLVRRLNALRHEHPALQADGDFEPVYARRKTYPFVYRRRAGREEFLVAVNPAARTATARLAIPGGRQAEMVLGERAAAGHKGGRLTLRMEGLSWLVLRVKTGRSGKAFV